MGRGIEGEELYVKYILLYDLLYIKNEIKCIDIDH